MHLIQQVSLCPHLVQSVRLLLFKYRGSDNVRWISKNKMAATAVQWELCRTNFRENIANLWVSCYNGNNDQSARVLFVQHPREQGQWLLHHSPCSLGCWTNNTLAAWSLSLNISHCLTPCSAVQRNGHWSSKCILRIFMKWVLYITDIIITLC